MNKIKIKNNEIKLVETDELIEILLIDKLEITDVQKIKINVKKNTELFIIYDNKTESKLDIEYNIYDNTTFKVTEIRKEKKTEVQYNYQIGENSKIDILKFYDVEDIKELDVINLNGSNSVINYEFKTITNGNQKYNLYVYHNNKNTESNIINHGVNLNGAITFDVTGVVYNKITGCTLNQINKIITFDNDKCAINPNLLIEENDVIANHSALIGKFSEEEIFYLMSRGISKEDSIKLLTRGFLLDGIENKEITKIIDKYWR